MIIYYFFVTLISVTIVIISYFAPDVLSLLGNETSQWFANVGLNLLWFTLLVKPVFMILIPYTELRTMTLWWLWEYLQTIKGRSFKWLWCMIVSIIYFVAGMGMKFRRLLGITTFLAIFTHAGIYIAGWIQSNFLLVNQLQTRNILAGYVGILCLFVGYITSNNFSLRFFKWHWKTIQYTSYIALIFAILHLLFLNPGEYWGQLIILMLYSTLKLMEKKKLNIL